MSNLNIAQQFFHHTLNLKSEPELCNLLEDATIEIGFRYFAMISHADLRHPRQGIIRIDNYPSFWAERFIEEGFYAQDPILQASLTTSIGFAWSDVSKMIKITAKQRTILKNAAKYGLETGFTVPANIPGEISGSCSFVTRPGIQIPIANCLLAQLIGAFAFQAARRLNRNGQEFLERTPSLTPRQRDCLVWAIRGKTDWETGRILGLKEDTVTEYLDTARERYGVTKRLPLAVHAIFDGQISFMEALF